MFDKRIKTHHSAMADSKRFVMGPRAVEQYLGGAMVKADADTARLGTIYIHVPFCSKICSFCNMRRKLQQPDERYHEYVVKEIEQYAKLHYVAKEMVFDAVYFGGGTPTMLSAGQLVKIIEALKSSFTFTPNAEMTIETTVSELDDEKIERLVAAGVNRFSVGIQTFNDRGRQMMNRKGTGENAYRKIQTLKGYQGVTVSLDLIYNYPGQTMEDLQGDLQKYAELGVDGFSLYSLINMKETSIEEAGALQKDKDMFFAIAETMEAKGYRFLEITKMVKDDEYRYIMNRHRGADTLPLGAGAGGNIAGLMMMNEIELNKYYHSVEEFAARKGMLFSEGYKKIAKFKGDIQSLHLPQNKDLYSDTALYESVVEQMREQGMLQKDCDDFTAKGVFWGNNISRTLSDLIEAPAMVMHK